MAGDLKSRGALAAAAPRGSSDVFLRDLVSPLRVCLGGRTLCGTRWNTHEETPLKCSGSRAENNINELERVLWAAFTLLLCHNSLICT